MGSRSTSDGSRPRGRHRDGHETEVGAIAGMLERTESEPTPLQKEIAGVSKLLGITVIVIAVLVMVTIVLINEVSSLADLVTVLLLGVSLAVAAVPEGLPAILSVVLAIGVQRMARCNAVVKELHSVETFGSASVIASNKTGTLTSNEMTIGRIVTASGQIELTGAGYRPEGQILQGTREASDPVVLQEARMVLAGGSFVNDAQLIEHDGQWQIQGDPTEAAFLVAARKLAGVTERVGEFERQGEIPFTSERKLMSALACHKEFDELALVTKGAPDVLLGPCTDAGGGGHCPAGWGAAQQGPGRRRGSVGAGLPRPGRGLPPVRGARPSRSGRDRRSG